MIECHVKKSKARKIGKPNYFQIDNLAKELVKTDGKSEQSQKQEKIK